jgi:hypothetical protein
MDNMITGLANAKYSNFIFLAYSIVRLGSQQRIQKSMTVIKAEDRKMALHKPG